MSTSRAKKSGALRGDGKTVYVLYTEGAVPVRKCHLYVHTESAPKPIHLAVTLPGGFTGFGSTSTAAIDMAVSRASAYKKRAIACGFSEDDWFAAALRRTSPLLMILLDSKRRAAKRVRGDGEFAAVPAPKRAYAQLTHRWQEPSFA